VALPLWANFEVLNICSRLRANLNIAYFLHLFSNPFNPTPGVTLAQFTECAFGGYAPLSLNGLWSAATFVQDGQYELTAVPFVFNCTGSPSGQIAGWYLTQGTSVAACEAFTTPIQMSTGSSFSLTLRPQVISQSIL